MNLNSTLLFVLALHSQVAMAYEENTHRALSETATMASVLADPTHRARIGLARAINDSNRPELFSSSTGRPLNALDLILLGTKFEDDLPRSVFHFFDPRNGQAMFVDASAFPGATQSDLDLVNGTAIPSPDWALGERCPPNWPCNAYSLKKARDYFYEGITNSLANTRKQSLGLLFESLGTMIHHLQDMAQPQHVRNDVHLHNDLLEGLCTIPSIALISMCRSFLAVVRPSAYERWTERNDVLENVSFTGYSPVYGASGSGVDGLSTFRVPRAFWTASGKGIADFTNRNFFSAGTTSVMPPLVGTSVDVDASILCSGAVPPCAAPILPGDVVRFWSSVVDDQLRTSNANNPFSAGDSIFDPEFATRNPGQHLYTVNRFTFHRDHEFLLPRAVGYSAGFINYFFRGTMEIALPPEGVYSVVDTTGAGCLAPCGFRRIKLFLRNATPTDDMGAGTLRLVVKFHRNNCYRSDLSGEFGGAQFFGNSCRSASGEVTASDPQIVSEVGRAFSASPLEFGFPAPIPINASDVVLQVVFRGILGEEADAVAVTTKDIAEPSHFAVANVTDYVYDDVGDQQYHPLGYAGVATSATISDFGIALGSNQTPLASVPVLRAGEFARLALLTDKFSDSVPVTYWYWGSSHPGFGLQPDAFELDEATGQYRRSCPVYSARGLYWDKMLFFPQYRSSSNHGPISGQLAGGAPTSSRSILQRRAAVGATFDCALPTGPEFDLSPMAPLSVPNAIAWTVNF